MKNLRLVLAALAVVASGTLAGARQEPPHEQVVHEVDQALTPHDLDDEAYVRLVKHHHELGVRMARLATQRAQRGAVRQFAMRAAADQERDTQEILKIEQALAARPIGTAGRPPAAQQPPEPLPSLDEPPADAGIDAPPPTVEEEHAETGQRLLQLLEHAEPGEFDREFLGAMARHYGMGAHMSRPSTPFESLAVQRLATELADRYDRALREVEALRRQQGR